MLAASLVQTTIHAYDRLEWSICVCPHDPSTTLWLSTRAVSKVTVECIRNAGAPMHTIMYVLPFYYSVYAVQLI